MRNTFLHNLLWYDSIKKQPTYIFNKYFSANCYALFQIFKMTWGCFAARKFFLKTTFNISQHHDVMSHVSYFLGYQTSVIYPWTACSVVLHLWTFGLQLSTNKIYRPSYRGGILSRKVLFFQVSNDKYKKYPNSWILIFKTSMNEP